MSKNLRWDVWDVFRAGRYGFSGKKITLHFLGLLCFYVVYEILLYLSLWISGTETLRAFWQTYALLPVCPFSDFSELPVALPLLTQIAMWIGMVVAFVVFFLASTAVSKVAIEQLRGDEFYSMKEAGGFLKKQGVSIFGTFVMLILLFIFCIIWPIGVGLLGKIPAVGNVFVLLASFLVVPAFFLGLLMVLIAVVFIVSLFFTPAVTAVEAQDTFENVYQLFSLLWNQPWRLVVYESMLLLTKLLAVPVLAVVSLGGMALVLTPLEWLIPDKIGPMMGYTDRWLGGLLSWVQDAVPGLSLAIGSAQGGMSPLLWIATVLLTALWIGIVLFVVAYLLSIASVGNTLIYVILRHKTSGDNLLEVPEEEETTSAGTAPSPEEPQPSEKSESEKSEEEAPSAEQAKKSEEEGAEEPSQPESEEEPKASEAESKG